MAGLLSPTPAHKLALPDRFLRQTADDAPETSSERKFAGLPRVTLPTADQWAHHHWPGIDPQTGHRRGLRSALAEAKATLKEKARHEKQLLREAKQMLRDKAREEKQILRRKALRERAIRRARRRQQRARR